MGVKASSSLPAAPRRGGYQELMSNYPKFRAIRGAVSEAVGSAYLAFGTVREYRMTDRGGGHVSSDRASNLCSQGDDGLRKRLDEAMRFSPRFDFHAASGPPDELEELALALRSEIRTCEGRLRAVLDRRRAGSIWRRLWIRPGRLDGTTETDELCERLEAHILAVLELHDRFRKCCNLL